MSKLTTRKQMFQYAVIAVVLGCSAPVAATDLAGDQKVLNTQRQQWDLFDADEYVFQFERNCFCVPESIIPGLVHVVQGRIESVRHTETNELLDPSFYLTVDELFDQVQWAIDFSADELLVEYDVSLGYTTSIDIDFIELAIDDERSFRASDLHVISRPPSIDIDFILLAVDDERSFRGRDLQAIPEPQSIVLMILGLVLWRPSMASTKSEER